MYIHVLLRGIVQNMDWTVGHCMDSWTLHGQLDTGQLDTGQLDTGQLDTGQLDTGLFKLNWRVVLLILNINKTKY